MNKSTFMDQNVIMTSAEPSMHIIYNTGDEIWMSYQGNKPIVIKVKTHDGIVWEAESDGYCDLCNNRSSHLKIPSLNEPPLCPSCYKNIVMGQ